MDRVNRISVNVKCEVGKGNEWLVIELEVGNGTVEA